MPGIAQDYLIYPILDIVRQELRRYGISRAAGGGSLNVVNLSLDETPSVEIVRGHPLDDKAVIGAVMYYSSGVSVQIDLQRGEEVEADHPDYDYITNWRLSSLTITTYDSGDNVILTLVIRLNYDSEGLFHSTEVLRL